MEKVDIVVVGAGPGGSSFARKASEAGLKVVVLEKRSAVGEPVRCGEAIGEDALNPFKLKPSRRFLAQETNSTSFFSPKGKKQNTRAFGKGFIVERISFDKELSAFASSAGARIMTRTRATGARREGKKVFVKASRFGKKLDFECSLLVAADGIESRVANWFGIKTNYPPSELASCTQVELAGIKLEKQDEIQLYLGSICPGGYVWVFPKGKDRANVGLGLPISHVKEKPALDYLTEFLKKDKRFSKASIIQDSCGVISVSLPLKEISADNLMIVGTAARQVSAIDGGGIGFAITAGQIAAEVAIEAFKQNDFSRNFLRKYDERWEKKEGKMMRNMYKARMAFSEMTDDEIDYLVENIDKLDISSIQQGKGFGKAIGFFLKKPSLARLARHLL